MDKLKELKKSLVNKYLSNNKRGTVRVSDDWARPEWCWVSADLDGEFVK